MLTVSVCGDYQHDNRTEVDLFLSKPTSCFPREVVKALGITLHKTPGADAITCKGEVDGLSLHIYSCPSLVPSCTRRCWCPSAWSAGPR